MLFLKDTCKQKESEKLKVKHRKRYTAKAKAQKKVCMTHIEKNVLTKKS